MMNPYVHYLVTMGPLIAFVIFCFWWTGHTLAEVAAGFLIIIGCFAVWGIITSSIWIPGLLY